MIAPGAVGCKRRLGRRLRTSDPVAGTTVKVHHGENSHFVVACGVEESVRKPPTQTTPNVVADQDSSLGMAGDGLGASTRLKKERRAQAALLVLVVLGRLVQLTLGQFVEGDGHPL
jgi:hypothetical protein